MKLTGQTMVGNRLEAPDSEQQQQQPTETSLEEADHGLELDHGEEPEKQQCRICCCIRMSLSILLLVIFVYSTVVQFNDENLSVAWTLFYLLHAIVILLILALLRRGNTLKAEGTMFTLLPVIGISLWSLVFIAVTSLELSRTPAGGPEEGGDNPGASEREEIAYELAGACLGLVSAAYHGMMLHSYLYCNT